MAWYPNALRKNIPPPSNGSDPPIKARTAILHVAASEGPSLYNWFNGPSGGIESHFYIRYDGTVEQYRDTDYQADANVMANGFAVSIETEGLAGGKWTDKQLAAIKALLLWLNKVEGIPLRVPKTWDDSGVGYHVLFEKQWDGRGAVCPGPNRIEQFKKVLVPWMAAPTTAQEDDMPLTTDDAKTLLTGSAVMKNPFATNPDTAPRVAASFLLEQTAKQVTALSAQVAALSAAVKALAQSKPGVDPNAVVAAVKASVDAALANVEITLSNKES